MSDYGYSQERPPLQAQPNRVNRVDDLRLDRPYVRHWCVPGNPVSTLSYAESCEDYSEVVIFRGCQDDKLQFEGSGGRQFVMDLEDLGLVPRPVGWQQHTFMAHIED